MADESIRKDFVEGINEIFTTLFNDGENDGVTYYELDLEHSYKNVYGESKYGKHYINPVKLVCKAELNPTHGIESIESVKDSASFTVTLKSLQDRNLGVTNRDLDKMRRGILEFKGVFYYIDNISPETYIEDVFLKYRFECTQIIEDITENIGDLNDV